VLSKRISFLIVNTFSVISVVKVLTIRYLEKEKKMKNFLFLIAMAYAMTFIPSALSADNKDIILPKHPANVKVDLVTALEQRKTVREYSSQKISPEDLSAMLWLLTE